MVECLLAVWGGAALHAAVVGERSAVACDGSSLGIEEANGLVGLVQVEQHALQLLEPAQSRRSCLQQQLSAHPSLLVVVVIVAVAAIVAVAVVAIVAIVAVVAMAAIGANTAVVVVVVVVAVVLLVQRRQHQRHQSSSSRLRAQALGRMAERTLGRGAVGAGRTEAVLDAAAVASATAVRQRAEQTEKHAVHNNRGLVHVRL